MNRIAQTFLAAVTLSLVGLTSIMTAGATTLVAPAMSLRTAPAQGAAIISTVAAGTTVNVGVCNSAWCYVNVGAQKGWVETKTLSSTLASANSQARMMARSSSGGAAAGVGGRTASAGLNISITIVPEDQTNVNKATKSNNGINVAKIAPQNLR